MFVPTVVFTVLMLLAAALAVWVAWVYEPERPPSQQDHHGD